MVLIGVSDTDTKEIADKMRDENDFRAKNFDRTRLCTTDRVLFAAAVTSRKLCTEREREITWQSCRP